MSDTSNTPGPSKRNGSLAKIPATIITGFLGAGKTTLLRHVLAEAKGRRIAVIVNEFGDIGFDGDLIGDCADPDCAPVKLTELTNGCICCTVADDFIPALDAILALEPKVDHILIETSGLALPKPLVKAFDWPSIRSKVTVDGVIAIADGPAVAAGRFAEDPAMLKPQPDGTIEHDFPLAEVFEDQIAIADMIILNKTDLMTPEEQNVARSRIAAELGRPVRIVPAAHGRIGPAILLGLNNAVEADLSNRPSHHDTELEHDHDDFDSFSLQITMQSDAASFAERLGQVALDYQILRTKGFAEIAGKPMRLVVQGVGGRISHSFDRAWAVDEPRRGRLVVIGLKGLDRAAITAALSK
jgi:cobalamin biosynthesis protein CobW